MRTEEQDWQDLEKRIGARTIDCTGCKKRKWIVDRWKHMVYVIKKVIRGDSR